MALRDALVIDKWRRCAPPDKRRRRAVARLLYSIRSIVSPNITQPNGKTTVRERSRPAEPLSDGSAFPRTQNIFLFTVYPFSGIRFFVVTVYLGFMSAEYGFARGRLGFCRIVRGFSRFQVIPFFNPLCYSVFVVEDNAIFCCG